jgi:hypothetical protein
MGFTPDLTMATSGLSAIKTGFDLVRGLVDLLKQPEIDRSAIQSKLLELQQLILDAQRALGETAEQNRHLTVALSQEERRKLLEADMEIAPDGNFYVRRSERDKNAFVPYCPVCWGHEGKTVPLVPRDHRGFFECAIHKARYYTEAYRRTRQAEETRGRSTAEGTGSSLGNFSQRWMG